MTDKFYKNLCERIMLDAYMIGVYYGKSHIKNSGYREYPSRDAFPYEYKWCFTMGYIDGENIGMEEIMMEKGFNLTVTQLRCNINEMIKFEQNMIQQQELYVQKMQIEYNIEPDIENNIKLNYHYPLYNMAPDIENNIKPNPIIPYENKRKISYENNDLFVPHKKTVYNKN